MSRVAPTPQPTAPARNLATARQPAHATPQARETFGETLAKQEEPRELENGPPCANTRRTEERTADAAKDTKKRPDALKKADAEAKTGTEDAAAEPKAEGATLLAPPSPPDMENARATAAASMAGNAAASGSESCNANTAGAGDLKLTAGIAAGATTSAIAAEQPASEPGKGAAATMFAGEAARSGPPALSALATQPQATTLQHTIQPVAAPALLPAADVPVATPATPQSASTTPATPVPVSALPMAIAAETSAGARSFTIRLDPAELGEVQIRLNIGEDGVPRAHLIVERPSTLHQLMQDAPRLEQALNQAGSAPAGVDVTFSLRQDAGGGNAPHQRRETAEPNQPGDTPFPAMPLPRALLRHATTAASRLDLML